MDAMKELERQAEKLLAEVTELRRKNRLLTGRVKKLERTAREIEGASISQSERSELERRVRHLVQRLERLDSR